MMESKTLYVYFAKNYYSCLDAANEEDALEHLGARYKSFELVVVELCPKMARLATIACQNIRRAIFEGARTPVETLEAIASFEDRGWIPKFN
jgi:hypothetical protein